MMKNFVFALLFCIGKILLGQESDKIMIHKGNQSYKKQDFDRASYYYIEAIKKSNNDFKALYNLGNSLYRKGMYADAINEYQNALKNTQNRHEQKITLYNMGNAQFLNKDIQSAIKSYQNALKLEPDNPDILRNLRIAKKQEEKQKKQYQNKNQNIQNSKLNQKNTQKEQEKNKEEEFIKKIEEKERNTTHRALNHKGYSTIRNNKEDW